MENIKGIIFDYGGTIDCRGDHWAVIIHEAYEHAGLPLSVDTFRPAYVHAERELARVRHILPEHNFLDMMRIKARIELEYLVANGILEQSRVATLAEGIARYCYRHAAACIEHARPVLEALAARYPMVLVTNFYGNIEAVLRDFRLDSLFPTIIESAVVGIRKPDARIFALGVEAMGLQPQDVLVVGDSISKDILPAESLGCRTAWIAGRPWFGETLPQDRKDKISDLGELLPLLTC